MTKICIACGEENPGHLMMQFDTEVRLGGTGNSKRFWVCERSAKILEGILEAFQNNKTNPLFICGPMELGVSVAERGGVEPLSFDRTVFQTATQPPR